MTDVLAEFVVMGDYDGVVTLEHDNRTMEGGRFVGEVFPCKGVTIELRNHNPYGVLLRDAVTAAEQHKAACQRCRLGHDWCGKPAGHDGWCDASNAPALSYKTSNIEELSDAKRALVLDDGRGGEITVYRQPGGCLEINQPDDETGEQDIIHVCDIERWRELVVACVAVAERVPVRH